MTMLTPDSPCTVEVTPGDSGGVSVDVFVPTYEGGATFNLMVERDNDGDWRVFIPWPTEVTNVETGATLSFDNGILGVLDGMEVANGILYLAAPDVEVEANA